MRKAHWLTPNDGNEMPSELVFVDTETEPEHAYLTTEYARLKLGWACRITRKADGTWTKGTWVYFTTIDLFWEWLFSIPRNKTAVYVYAHNWSFDFTVLQGFKNLTSAGWKITKAIIDGPPFIIHARNEKKTLRFVDTLNYFRQSLADLGEKIGIAKGDYRKSAESLDQLSAYCKQDVRIILEAMRGYINFIYSNNLGNYKETLAGQAFTAFRHRFMPYRIFIDTHARALEISRAAYYGGRTEANYIGPLRKPVTLVDVNSMYPFVMQQYDYPTRLISCIKTCTKEELTTWLEYRLACADVTLQTPEPIFPLRLDDRLVFPIGRFRTHLSTPELIVGLQRQYIKRIHGVSLYERAPIFKPFVEYFYDKRLGFKQTGDLVYSHMSKILQNSLYGKFGQSGRVWDKMGEVSPNSVRVWTEYDVPTGITRRFREFGGVMQEIRRGSESANSHPAIAAHVTAYARMYLWELMTCAGRNNVAYLDTDSLLVNDNGLAKLTKYLNNDRLGALKVERRIETGFNHGAKDYQWGDVVKIKGIKRQAIQLSPTHFWQPTFIGMNGMLQLGDMDNMRIRHSMKELTREYRKGTVRPSGRVDPLVVKLK